MRERSVGAGRFWGVCLLSALVIGGAPLATAADLVQLKSGEVITSSDLSQYLERRVDLRASSRSKWGVEQVLREMAMGRALVQEGERLGEKRQPGKEGDRFDDAYAMSVFRKLMPPCDPPADATAARKFFDENPQAFRVPPMARLNRVMLPASETVDGMAAMDWMMAQAKLIASGAQPFEAMAKRVEGIYRLEAQGDIGWAVLVDENVILRTLAAAKQGDMVGPVREGDFVYLFSIDDKRDSRQLAWDEVAVSAAARAVNYCRQTATRKLEQDLLAKYGVVMNSAAISGLFEKAQSK
ncbi:peptidylprolyl isomerase [Acidovorax sp. ACV02]|uniref:peptidylprolyl isomerase n=1 Tax=Acidovorax sp. ACV02 TaxID=2769310 RepID=UPI001CE1A50E|nr:peptidylprolyl isomerase [Acidovorax sp. ACV02]